MNLRKILSHFAKSQNGAVTIDWTLITAALVALAVVVVTNIESGSTGMANNTAAVMDSIN